MSFLREVLARLAGADVRFVVVGGVAVVLHGHMRATKDLDLVIDLEPAAARRALDVFTQMGLRPTAPVSVYDFADAAIRQSWIADKNMTVFSFTIRTMRATASTYSRMCRWISRGCGGGQCS